MLGFLAVIFGIWNFAWVRWACDSGHDGSRGSLTCRGLRNSVSHVPGFRADSPFMSPSPGEGASVKLLLAITRRLQVRFIYINFNVSIIS